MSSNQVGTALWTARAVVTKHLSPSQEMNGEGGKHRLTSLSLRSNQQMAFPQSPGMAGDVFLGDRRF